MHFGGKQALHFTIESQQLYPYTLISASGTMLTTSRTYFLLEARHYLYTSSGDANYRNGDNDGSVTCYCGVNTLQHTTVCCNMATGTVIFVL
jgi:hypothetical protein